MNSVDFVGQFAEMLKLHSIVVNDRSTLLKLFENVIDLCTKTPKTKLKSAIKAETDAAEPKKTAPKKKMPMKPVVVQPVAEKLVAEKPVAEKLVGEIDAGECPVISDITSTTARGRGRPRKEVSSDENVAAVDGEKKKRGRPKKEKSLVMSSNADEDALIAQMLTEMKKTQHTASETESETEQMSTSTSSSASPILTASVSCHEPIQVEQDVLDEEPPAPKANAKPKAPKEPKVKTVKEPKAKTVKEPKVPKSNAKILKSSVKEPETKTSAITTPAITAPAITEVNVTASACSAAPVRETKAGSDGMFYLMPNFPRSSFTYNGKTYLRTETDNVYDNLTLELIGVWDHLNHEIITPNDDDVEDLDALWSDEE